MGDIFDELPNLPAAFITPRIEAVTKKEGCTVEQAISSISRIARLAYQSSDLEGKSNREDCKDSNQKNGKIRGADPAQTVMQVRALRAERDELRRRDRLLKDENAQLRLPKAVFSVTKTDCPWTGRN